MLDFLNLEKSYELIYSYFGSDVSSDDIKLMHTKYAINAYQSKKSEQINQSNQKSKQLEEPTEATGTVLASSSKITIKKEIIPSE